MFDHSLFTGRVLRAMLVGYLRTHIMSWDGEYTVSMDHLKLMEYSDSNCQQMKEVCDRITKLLSNNKLEDAAIKMLKHLGEVKRPYLTQFEEKLLNFIEQECGVMDEASHNQG